VGAGQAAPAEAPPNKINVVIKNTPRTYNQIHLPRLGAATVATAAAAVSLTAANGQQSTVAGIQGRAESARAGERADDPECKARRLV